MEHQRQSTKIATAKLGAGSKFMKIAKRKLELLEITLAVIALPRVYLCMYVSK